MAKNLLYMSSCIHFHLIIKPQLPQSGKPLFSRNQEIKHRYFVCQKAANAFQHLRLPLHRVFSLELRPALRVISKSTTIYTSLCRTHGSHPSLKQCAPDCLPRPMHENPDSSLFVSSFILSTV